MRNRLIYISIIFICSHFYLQAQGVSVAENTAPPHESAMLDVQSTVKGILIPTMTSANRDIIPNPRHGLMVFVDDTDNNNDGFYYFNANIGSEGEWIPLGTGTSLWEVEGDLIQNTNADAVVISGNDQENKLLFKGTYGDNQEQYSAHTAIVERIYEPDEKSELLIFKGNDDENGNGPDRVRIDAVGGLVVQVGNARRDYNPTVEGNTVLSVMPNNTVGIGEDPNWLRVEFPENDASYPNKKNGNMVLRAVDSRDGTEQHRRVMVVGGDGNEINVFNESGTVNTGSTLFFNYNLGNTVRVGGYDPAAVTNLEVQGCVSATNIACSSDARLKKNIQPIKNVLPILSKLRPVTFNWNYEEDKESLPHYGLIAQEVEGVIPSIVSENEPDRNKAPDAIAYKTVAYSEMVPLLIKGLLETNERIDEIPSNGSNVEVAQLKKALRKAQAKMDSQQEMIDDLNKRLARMEKLITDGKAESTGPIKKN